MGFSKKTGRGRLDKFYYLAKEQGYRARSAFKLKQLDQKYKFLGQARVLVDLCAAPGGWLQVAAESMPMSHVIVGVDLVPIKPIKGVVTFVGDITTEKCRAELRKELKTWRADVVLHDGAPNVGNAWIQDAFSQAELTLHSFKLASEFLNEGGVFVTKVFRSKEYPLVVAALKKYFKKVEATKPESSRTVSAEIFVFCKGFDVKFCKGNPVNIREILSGDLADAKSGAVTNILHPEKKKVNRDGYEDNVTILHKTVSMFEFLNSKEPEQLLASTNVITISTDDEKKFVEGFKNSEDIVQSCADLKVLGRREFKALLKLHKGFTKIGAEQKKSAQEASDAESSDSDLELFDELKSHARAAKKKQKRLSRVVSESKNHIDISYEQGLSDDSPCHENEGPAECKLEEDIFDDDWYSSPMFVEVYDEITSTQKAGSQAPVISHAKSQESDLSTDERPSSGPLPSPVDEDDIVDLSFNRYAFNDERSELPKWFVEDEGAHNVPQEPITKEVADLLRENERLIKNRLPKKVVEAKNRNKMKALRKLQTLKKKAAVIADSEDVTSGQKVAQIRKLLSKAKVERARPKVVVAKGKLRALKGRPNGVKGRYKMVDRRMLKDLKAAKNKKK